MKQSVGIILVLVFSLFLFSWKLGIIPSGVYADEATVGYNAKSLLLTGRDEYGEVFPVLFRFFGAYTPGMMVYLLVPMVKLFGLTSWSIRMPSLIFGLGSIVAVYAFLRQWMQRKDATIGAFFYAILPWTVFVSRLGYEVTLGYLLYVIGMYFGFKGVSDDRQLKWAILFLSLSSYAAHVQRYLLPFLIILLGMSLIGNKTKKVNKKSVFVGLGILVFTQVPNIYLAIKHPGFWVKNSAISQNLDVTVENFTRQYLTYLSPKTIFDKAPDIDKQHEIPGTGMAFWWMVWPLSVGLFELMRNYQDTRSKFILGLLLVSIIPASFSGVFISMQRALPLLLPLSLVVGIGISKINKPKIMTVLAVYSLVLLWRSYFVMLPTLNSTAWNSEYKMAAALVKNNPDTKFVFDNSRNERSYMLIAFWLGEKAKNVEYRPIIWKTDPCKKQILIGDKLAVSADQVDEHKLKMSGVIEDALGEGALLWYETNPIEKCGTIEQ